MKVKELELIKWKSHYRTKKKERREMLETNMAENHKIYKFEHVMIHCILFWSLKNNTKVAKSNPCCT